MKHYILMITSGVDAEALGPFATAIARDAEAKALAASAGFNRDYDSIFRMDIENEQPGIHPFAFGELAEDAEPTASKI